MTVEDREGAEAAAERRRPSFAATLSAILLPVVLMLGKAIADVIAADSESPAKALLDFLGTPVVALGLAVLAGMALLGRGGGGMDRKAIAGSLESSLPPDRRNPPHRRRRRRIQAGPDRHRHRDVIADAIKDSALPVLFLAWLVAVLIRVATGSATVATVTASGILAPVAAELTSTHVSLMVLAIGSGSLFLSHVNDAGFWLVKEYLGVTVVQNLKTWTVMECIISVTGLAGVLALSVFI